MGRFGGAGNPRRGADATATAEDAVVGVRLVCIFVAYWVL